MSSIPPVDNGDVPSLRDDCVLFSVEEGAGALFSGSAVIAISFWTVHGGAISHVGATALASVGTSKMTASSPEGGMNGPLGLGARRWTMLMAMASQSQSSGN